MKGTLTLEAGDGTKIVEIAFDQVFPELFQPDGLRQAAASVREALRLRFETPARAMVLAYIDEIKAARYPRGRRLDEPREESGWPAVDPAGEELVDAVFESAMRDHHLDVAS